MLLNKQTAAAVTVAVEAAVTVAVAVAVAVPPAAVVFLCRFNKSVYLSVGRTLIHFPQQSVGAY